MLTTIHLPFGSGDYDYGGLVLFLPYIIKGLDAAPLGLKLFMIAYREFSIKPPPLSNKPPPSINPPPLPCLFFTNK